MKDVQQRGLVVGLILGWLGLVILVGLGAAPGPALAQAGSPTPAVMVTSSFMTPPPTVYPHTQAGDGGQVYYQYCMTCHGDRGQGLTQEWRDQIGAPDTNCWAAHCHASNRFGSNFAFPKNVPALVGPEVLPGFSNALNLHDFMKNEMPFQMPGALSDAQYWQLTAYLLQLNGVPPGSQPLDAAQAAQIRFTQGENGTVGQRGAPVWTWLAGGLAGVVILAGGALVWRRGKRK
jgi:mono/diheme cytochrome c family protein